MENSLQTFAAMQEGKPYKSYIKTILGRVCVHAIDPFSGNPTALLLEGDPRKHDESSIIHVWNEREDLFFRRQNRVHFETGVLTVYTPVETAKPQKRLEEFSDEELKELLNKPFLALQNAINKTDSDALLFRLINLATELNKSESILKALRARLSEVQLNQQPSGE